MRIIGVVSFPTCKHLHWSYKSSFLISEAKADDLCFLGLVVLRVLYIMSLRSLHIITGFVLCGAILTSSFV